MVDHWLIWMAPISVFSNGTKIHKDSGRYGKETHEKSRKYGYTAIKQNLGTKMLVFSISMSGKQIYA